GPKTAAQLLGEFGDLETLLARADEIKQVKRRENIIANADLARLSRRLVELSTTVPLDMPLDELVLEPQDGARLIGFLKTMEFTTLTRRVAEACNCDASVVDPTPVAVEWGAGARGPDLDAATAMGQTPAGPVAIDAYGASTPADLAKARAALFATAKIDKSGYIIIRNLEELDGWIRAARETGMIAFEAEGTSVDPMQADLAGFSLAISDNMRDPSGLDIRAAYVPFGHKTGSNDLLGDGVADDQLSWKDVSARLKPLLEDPSVLKVGHNLKYAYLVLKRHGIEMAGYDDVMLMSYVLEAGIGGHGLDVLSERWLGHMPVTFKEVAGSGKSGLTFDM